MHRLTLILAATFAVCVVEYWLPAGLQSVFGLSRVAWVVRVLLAASVLTAVFASSSLRSLFPIRSTWSWVGIIPLAYFAQNLALAFVSEEVSISMALAVIVVADGLAVGFLEEFFFRGVAFLKHPEDAPKTIVVITAFAFALSHFANLTVGSTVPRVVSVAAFALPMGILLGIIRLATGSIAWPAILHALVTSSGYFDVVAHVEGDPKSTAFRLVGLLLALATLGASVILLVRHPAMSAPLSNHAIERTADRGTLHF